MSTIASSLLTRFGVLLCFIDYFRAYMKNKIIFNIGNFCSVYAVYF